MPLPDSEFERGKCSYKLLQYAAAGLPAVASPVGSNSAIIERTGMLGPSEASHWCDALQEVVSMSPAERLRRAEDARKLVVDEYSFQSHTEQWLSSIGGK